MVDTCLYKLPRQLVLATLSRSTTITLSSLEPAEEDCFEHACVFDPCDIVMPAQLHPKQTVDSMLGRLAFLKTSSFDT